MRAKGRDQQGPSGNPAGSSPWGSLAEAAPVRSRSSSTSQLQRHPEAFLTRALEGQSAIADPNGISGCLGTTGEVYFLRLVFPGCELIIQMRIKALMWHYGC